MSKFSENSNAEQYANEEDIDLREIIFKYLRHWKWIVLSCIIFLIIGVFVYLKSDRKYEITTSVLLKENKGGGGAQKGGTLGSLEELGLISTTNNIDNEIAVFSSPNLMKQIVLSLEFQTEYYEDGLFRDIEVYKKCPYYVRLEDTKPDDLQGIITLTLNKNSSGGVDVTGVYKLGSEDYKIDSKLDNLPGFMELPSGLGRLYVSLRPETSLKEGISYIIYIRNAQKVAYQLASEIQIEPTTKSASVLKINLPVLNVSKGIDVLNEIVVTYNKNNVHENNEIATNTSKFINDQLKDISAELKVVEDDVVSFKTQQRITDLGTEAKVYVEQTSQIQDKRIELATQIKTIELIENFVQSPNNNSKLIPNLGITDPGLASVISEYNNLLLAYQRLERSASEDNPARIKALSDLNNTRQGILGSVNNIKRALDISKSEVDKQYSSIASRIQSVPMMERGLLERTRQQEIKQALFIYLMQVNLETGITMASTSDKAKVITDPVIPDGPIAPKRNMILLIALAIGFIIPIIVIYIKDLLQLSITSREELEKLSRVTVIGEIMKKEEEEIIVVEKSKTTPIVELFRTLRNNVQFILDDPEKKIILVTSTVPGEGKTFVSINLAASFALSKKKILLLGMDIRNPKLAADMGFAKSAGLTSYLSGSESDWISLLSSVKSFPNMDIMQAGAIPPNPNELLMKPALKELLKEARQIYDIIIIDSAPIGVVSDTFLLSSLADATVYVTRENVTPKNAITFINEVHHDNKLPNMYLVINGVEPSKNKGRYGRYGYGYTYGYGGHK
ncbi:MAG: polysaccharide biosynthesis tyrosine autokinase [Dysgonomonas sp.]